ncbi:hypothetical protein PRZ48_005359 [Zasmidium cellare]|uniref:FAD/NAD(P)-binding domain-containing protein n=1 Tax=Zasmidium cellare TaxID=395010 RepID=A0ABR0EUD1_ZASCE|nr:hypothetical protein PRZ48_005359 [Zasmidium cellare]
MPALTKPPTTFESISIFDVLIIGAGPAGLSAALALSRVNRTVAVFSSAKYRNARASHAHSILSRDHTSPDEIRRIGREQIEVYGTTQFVDKAVLEARRVDTGLFEVTDADGETWRGRKVILATGVDDVMMDIEGYSDCWGFDIWQCLVCDGIERADREAGTLGPVNMGMLMNVFTMLSLGCPRVTIFSNGPIDRGDKQASPAIAIAKAQGVDVEERKIRKLIHLEDEEGIDVVFEDDAVRRVGFLAVKPVCKLANTKIAEDLGVTIVDDPKAGPMLQISQPMCETTVPGVFSAGDACTNTKQFSQAMAQGGLVGAAVNYQLCMDQISTVQKSL